MRCLVTQLAGHGPVLGDIMQDDHNTERIIVTIKQRRDRVLYRMPTRVVFLQNTIPVRLDCPAGAQGLRHGALYGQLAGIIEQAEHPMQRKTTGNTCIPSRQLLGCRVHVLDLAIDVGCNNHLAYRVQGCLGAVLLALQFELGLLAVGDIQQVSGIVRDHTMLVPDRHGIVIDPANITGSIYHTVVNTQRDKTTVITVELGILDMLQVCRADHAGKGGAVFHQFVGIIAKLGDRLRHILDWPAILGAPAEYCHRPPGKQQSVPLQFVFYLLALAHFRFQHPV